MDVHQADHCRNSGRRRGAGARATNRPYRSFSRGRPLSLAVLLLALSLLLPAAATATGRQATPGLDPGRSSGEATSDRLTEASLAGCDLPSEVDTLALARVTLPPGATATAVGGAHLFFVESGALTFRQSARADGPPVTYGAGDQFRVSYDVASPPAITNEGTGPAVALVVSLAVTGGNGIEESLTGWAAVELLAVADAASVAPLDPANWAPWQTIAVSLTRVSYERGASYDIREPVARLLAIDSGAVNVVVAGPALYTPADDAAQSLPATARVSLTPGDQLLVPGNDRISTRNVARGPSAVLIVMVSWIYTFVPVPVTDCQG
jgi:hypothetical protein